MLLLLTTTPALAGNYTYIETEQLRDNLTAQKQLIILDIQFLGAYKAGHFADAIATYAYPLKTTENRAAIDAVLPELKKVATPIVIVSHRGGGGAMRAFDYLKERGIDINRLSLLRKGMQAWPYKEFVEVPED